MNKQIPITRIQNFFGFIIKKNTIGLGFDVAQHHTGIVILKTTDTNVIIEKTHKINVPKLPQNATNRQLLDSVNIFIDQLDSFKNETVQKYNINVIRVEDCFFGSNVKTLKALARSSILVYDRFKTIVSDIDFILPQSARNIIGFKKVDKEAKGEKLKKEIMAYINSALGTNIDDHDICDALILAICGLVREKKWKN